MMDGRWWMMDDDDGWWMMPSENRHEVGQAKSSQITALYTPQSRFKKCCFPQLEIEPNVGASRHIVNHGSLTLWQERRVLSIQTLNNPTKVCAEITQQNLFGNPLFILSDLCPKNSNVRHLRCRPDYDLMHGAAMGYSVILSVSLNIQSIILSHWSLHLRYYLQCAPPPWRPIRNWVTWLRRWKQCHNW